MAFTKVTTDGIADSAVSTAKIGANAVDTTKIGADVIVADDIADNAITVAQISDGAVSTAKIANDAVSTAKIADNAITAAKVNINIEDVSYVTKSTSDPARNTNPGAIGALWFNTTSGEMFMCTNATANANIWQGQNGYIIGGITSSTADPFGDRSSLALYQFEGNGNDTSGNGNNLSASSVTYLTSGSAVYGQGASFSGSISSRFTNTGFVIGNYSRTISFWYKNTNDDDIAVGLGAPSLGTGDNFAIAPRSNNITIYGRAGPGDQSIPLSGMTGNPIDGNWHHIVVTYDSTNQQLRAAFDGEFKGNTYGDHNYPTANGLYVGGWGNADRMMNGSIDQLRIFNRVLNAAEVLMLYNEVA